MKKTKEDIHNLPEKTIEERLRNLRLSRGYNLEDVGAEIGITGGAYGKIERGERGISAEHVIALAKLYEVPTDYILLGKDKDVLLEVSLLLKNCLPAKQKKILSILETILSLQ